ncbi:TetR/AcrR family transcriptional regulator [Amycolatopsis magusensis]|uniref:DNA-binding transcriptional regulator YbjK n=1 Tax=Amycolatopsis magusensis TaxID=882444 RepID=A0ABS4PNX9_9PSEU|nr:TetR/AcrR family transcriptional regulator [Amycolatopsis magusensis]MBP2181129.1 DNA-binding transcriptional regulator YbjK [Amycolatopsis magusensis]MDI5974913.1 TetR family transcriptional regulator [Amycolatopsis magusensis]
MRRNQARREALVDATIEVLAREGARGLTFRAVDAEAGVPVGTASNYFANRDDLLTQAGQRIHLRLGPEAEELEQIMRAPRDRELVNRLMHDILRRLTDGRSNYLALLELRLEATRRPELQATLTETLKANLAQNIDFHLEAGLPGDRDTVLLLYLAMTGLVVEHLTLPEVLAPFPLDEVIDTLVARVTPAGTGRAVAKPAGDPR